MTETIVAYPKIVSESEWLAERKKLLTEEKELTRHYDRVNAARRRLPMVKIEKPYTFEGPEGTLSFEDLFDGQTQLIVYHFMFDPTWERGCGGCTFLVNAIADISLLRKRDTNFVLVSRAPYPKLEEYKSEKGWTVPWYSSFGTEFNLDFHATLDPAHPPHEYNYRDSSETEHLYGKLVDEPEEMHGMSVFFRIGHDIFHTYSTYGRGTESITESFRMLDLTPYGRQEDFEDSPEGWPQQPTYG